MNKNLAIAFVVKIKGKKNILSCIDFGKTNPTR